MQFCRSKTTFRVWCLHSYLVHASKDRRIGLDEMRISIRGRGRGALRGVKFTAKLSVLKDPEILSVWNVCMSGQLMKGGWYGRVSEWDCNSNCAIIYKTVDKGEHPQTPQLSSWLWVFVSGRMSGWGCSCDSARAYYTIHASGMLLNRSDLLRFR